MHFREWQFFRVLIEISLKIVPKGPIDKKKKNSIGLDNDLAPNMRQAIIWNNAYQIHWHIYAALGGDELKYLCYLCLKWHWVRMCFSYLAVDDCAEST